MTTHEQRERRRDRAAEMYVGGASIEAIAHALNSSSRRIGDDLRRRGIPIRPRGRPSPGMAARRRRVEELRATRTPIRVIAAELGCPDWTVLADIRALGIQQ